MKKTSFLVVLVLLVGHSLFAQSTILCDSNVAFTDRNMIDYTIKVDFVRGKVLDPSGIVIPGDCIALFAADRSTLLRTVQADDNGRFVMSDVKNGDYWLVVQDPQRVLCPATAKLKVERSWLRRKTIVVHMKPHGLDQCSYCEAK